MVCGKCEKEKWPQTAGGPEWSKATVDDVLACLDAGVDVSPGDYYDWTALHFAAKYSKDPQIIKTLVSRGADVNANGKGNVVSHIGDYIAGVEHVTPLHLAALEPENPEVVTALVTAGAGLNSYDVRSYNFPAGFYEGTPDLTPLHYAALSHRSADAIALINAGADVNARRAPGRTWWDLQNTSGDTPLHFAALTANVEVITALINAGADVNARNQESSPQSNDYNTPLDFLGCYDEDEAEVLIAAGAKCSHEFVGCSSWCSNNAIEP